MIMMGHEQLHELMLVRHCLPGQGTRQAACMTSTQLLNRKIQVHLSSRMSCRTCPSECAPAA